MGILVVIAVVLFFLARGLSDDGTAHRAPDPMVQAAVEERIEPVGQVRVAGEEAPQAPAITQQAAMRSGEQIVQQVCASCHGPGVLGAPKLGNKADWAPRLDKGAQTLLTNAIKGIGQMPPRGGATDLSDEEVQRAVAAMLEEVGVSEPFGGSGQPAQQQAQAPAPAQPAPTAPAAAPAKAAPGEGADLAQGSKVYTQACAACHKTGAAGAPVTGNQAAWKDRIAKGMDTLVQHAIQGFGAMPPKGGRTDLSDEAVRSAVAYMVEESS